MITKQIARYLMACAAAAFVAWSAYVYHRGYSAGAIASTSKITRANHNATQIGGRAAARSADGGVRGQRDPSTRDD